MSSDPSKCHLLEPYTKDLTVNGQTCQVLRDSAATTDTVYPKYLSNENYMSERAWIRQAVTEGSVCLPMAKVEIEGPFGILKTVAAVLKGLPEEYPYLFSNVSEPLLNEQGTSFADAEAQMIVPKRLKGRELSIQLACTTRKELSELGELLSEGLLVKQVRPQIRIRITGNEKMRLTIMLACLAYGRKLPPRIIFRHKTIPKELSPRNVIVRCQEEGWMDTPLVLDCGARLCGADDQVRSSTQPPS